MAEDLNLAPVTGPDGLITMVGPDGKKYRKPAHYLDNAGLGKWRLPASVKKQAQEPANSGQTTVSEPAKPEIEKEARG
jgi:hypothetical protein